MGSEKVDSEGKPGYPGWHPEVRLYWHQSSNCRDKHRDRTIAIVIISLMAVTHGVL